MPKPYNMWVKPWRAGGGTQLGCTSPQKFSLLMDAFIVKTEAELIEIRITTCWSVASTAVILPQKWDGTSQM